MRGPFESAVFPAVFDELALKSGLGKLEIRRLVIQENLERQQDASCPAVRAMDWDDIFDTVAARLGVTLEAKAVKLANAHVRPPYAEVLGDADQVLKQLASPQRAIVVATKGLRKYQLPILDALGLTPLFTHILTPDVNNALKSDVAFYGDLPQLAELKISVGDHYADDVVAPKRFGFKAVWKVDRPHEASGGKLEPPFARPAHWEYLAGQTVRPDAIIFSLRELPPVVERLEKEKV